MRQMRRERKRRKLSHNLPSNNNGVQGNNQPRHSYQNSFDGLTYFFDQCNAARAQRYPAFRDECYGLGEAAIGGDTGEFGGPFDEEAVRLQVEERQAELRRVPGQEPQMVPVYTEASTPTDAAQLPRGEQSRQIAAKGVRMYAVILVDGKIVGTSGVTNLHPHDFCAPFDSAVQLQLLHAPTTMSVQLWERRLGGLADSMVSESFLAVPDVASPPMPDWQMYSFSAERTFTPRAAYQLGAKEDAAADSDLDADVRRLPRRCVSGQLAVSIAWSAQPATHERAARAAEASAAGASSFITAHARGKPLEGAHAAMPGALDPLRVGEHVRADELDPNALLCRVLEYLETPQYLRHALFPAGDRALSLAGVLPSLDVPHHARKADRAPFREGVSHALGSARYVLFSMWADRAAIGTTLAGLPQRSYVAPASK